jgi:hypothetical protein
MSLISYPNTGIEEVQRAAFYTLYDNLNDYIEAVRDLRAPSDEALADHLGIPYVPTEIETIEPENFYEGHRPSLIQAPVDKYPNCSVWTVRSTPGTGNELYDHQNIYRNLMYIEIMARSRNSEEEVNRRITRMAEAVNLCMLGNPTLNGAVSGHEVQGSGIISDVFTRREESNRGPIWYWQGARWEYAVRKEAVIPSSNAGSVFPTASIYDVDQF